MAKTSGLTVRQFTRRDVDFPAQLDVAEAHQQQVRFSPISGAPDSQSLSVRVVDVSPGGAGLASSVFVPRACSGVLRIFSSDPVEVRPDGTPVLDVVFEHEVKVRRTYMTGHEPTFFVGVAFVDPPPDIDSRIRAILEQAGCAAPDGVGGLEAGDA